MLNRREFTGLLSAVPFLNFLKPKAIELEVEVVVEKTLDNYPVIYHRTEFDIFKFKPGTFNIIMGRPKTGKSLVARHIWHKNLSKENQRISSEYPEAFPDLPKNFKSIVCDNKIYIHDPHPTCYRQTYNCDLLIYDNFGTGSARIPEDRYARNKLFVDMQRFAVNKNICIIVCMQCNKDDRLEYIIPMYQADTILHCTRNEDETFKVTARKTRDLPMGYSQSFTYEELKI